VLAEFVAAPWLLPPRTKALRYAGVHTLEELLQLRATPQGNHTKTIAVLLFSKTLRPWHKILVSGQSASLLCSQLPHDRLTTTLNHGILYFTVRCCPTDCHAPQLQRCVDLLPRLVCLPRALP
jgi:hypothetical protein